MTGQPTPDWQVASDHEPHRIIGAVDGGHGDDGQSQRCTEVCEVAEGLEFEANRALILAAGDLRKALTVAYETIDSLARLHDPCHEIYMRCAPEIKQIKAAIAKAGAAQ